MSKKPAAKSVMNFAAFKAMYDDDIRVPTQIKAGLASLLAEGKDSCEYEIDFLKRCGDRVGNTHLTKYREQFAPYLSQVKEKGKNTKWVWFADKKFAAKARGEI